MLLIGWHKFLPTNQKCFLGVYIVNTSCLSLASLCFTQILLGLIYSQRGGGSSNHIIAISKTLPFSTKLSTVHDVTNLSLSLPLSLSLSPPFLCLSLSVYCITLYLLCSCIHLCMWGCLEINYINKSPTDSPGPILPRGEYCFSLLNAAHSTHILEFYFPCPGFPLCRQNKACHHS